MGNDIIDENKLQVSKTAKKEGREGKVNLIYEC